MTAGSFRIRYQDPGNGAFRLVGCLGSRTTCLSQPVPPFYHGFCSTTADANVGRKLTYYRPPLSHALPL